MRRTHADRPGALAAVIARWLVRHYPEPWRARYEDEVLALLDDASVRWRDVIDLSRGLVTERAMSLFEPGDHPAAASVMWVFFTLGTVIAAWLVAAMAGYGLRRLTGPLPAAAGLVGIVLGLAMWPWIFWRYGLSYSFRRLRLVPMSHWWFAVVLLTTVLEHWTTNPAFFGSTPMFWPVLVGIPPALPTALAVDAACPVSVEAIRPRHEVGADGAGTVRATRGGGPGVATGSGAGGNHPHPGAARTGNRLTPRPGLSRPVSLTPPATHS